MSYVSIVCQNIHSYDEINTFNCSKRKRDVIDESFYGENDDNWRTDESEGGHLDHLKDLIRPSETQKEVFQTQSHINEDQTHDKKKPEIETGKDDSGNVPELSELHDLEGTRNEETRISESENQPLVTFNVLSVFLYFFYLCLSRFVSLSVSLSFCLSFSLLEMKEPQFLKVKIQLW
jgi:hypothetical protein